MKKIIFLSLFLAACVTVDNDDPDKGTKNNGNPNNGNLNNGAPNNGGSNGQNNGLAGNCQDLCVAKAILCGAPSDQGQLFCKNDICISNPTDSEMMCFQEKSCPELLGFFQDPDGTICGIGVGTPNNGVTNNGMNACIKQNATGCNSSNNPSNCCNTNASCFGKGNLQGETICCNPVDKPCEKTTDCCNDDNDIAPVRCQNKVCAFDI